MTDSLEELAELIAHANAVVVLTGAGMSTESGLPDYRGSAGLWRNRRFEELACIEALEREPAEFWEFYRERLAVLADAAPNPGHLALAELERSGHVTGLITQNVDGLHARAGSSALEVHGSLRTADCRSCARRWDMVDVIVRMQTATAGIPLCDCGSVLKPSVVLFGEMLPPAIEEAAALAGQADVLIVCGSSLAVAPVSRLPLIVLGAGGQLVIINDGPTEFDVLADMRFSGRLAQVLPLLADLLGEVS
ncbi:MAG: NAD-dependent deacylase [Thermoleophilia bacterium]|nr:NAD-dependent deacylase [Thermoleophilia bacterium]